MDVKTVADVVASTATAAGAVGVWFAYLQLRLTKQQAVAAFEEGFNARYRAIAEGLPVEVLLGEIVAEEVVLSHLGSFYQYADLTNEQIRLRREGRISDATWREWRDGIEWALGRPAFRRAWSMIDTRSSDSFREIRRLLREECTVDPRRWKK